MQRFELILALASVLGFLNGAMWMKTEWEAKARRLMGPWLLFGASSTITAMASVLVSSLFGLAMFLGPPIIALEYLQLLPLRGNDMRWFFGTYIVCIGVGGLARYLFWRWRFRGVLV